MTGQKHPLRRRLGWRIVVRMRRILLAIGASLLVAAPALAATKRQLSHARALAVAAWGAGLPDPAAYVHATCTGKHARIVCKITAQIQGVQFPGTIIYRVKNGAVVEVKQTGMPPEGI